MANLFEKPIAANPISKFVGLPLEHISKALDRRTQNYEKGRAQLEEAEDFLFESKYLQGDAARHHELQQKYTQELDDIAERSNGDYSGMLGTIDNYSRKMKRELKYGELGAQNTAYAAAMARKKDEDTRLSKGQSSQEGYNMFLGSIAGHKTTQTEDGGFSTFQGYTPSNVTEILKPIQDGIDEINAKYDAEGMKHIDADIIKRNALTNINTNSGLRKAIQERIYGQVDAKGEPIKYEDYVNTLVNNVVSDKKYHEKTKLTGANADGSTTGSTEGQFIQRVGAPTYASGELSYDAGSAFLAKQMASEWLGMDGMKRHRDWVESPEGQARIDFMEYRTQTKAPKDPGELRDWIVENASQGTTADLYTEPASKTQQKAVTSEGMFMNPETAVRDITGRTLSSDEVADIQGSVSTTDGRGKRTTKVQSIVGEGSIYPPGTRVIIGHNGNTYFQEPSNPEVLRSPEYNIGLVKMAKASNTGVINISTKADIGTKMPAGNYTVEFMPPTTKRAGEYKISQNGKPVLRMYNKGGEPIIDNL